MEHNSSELLDEVSDVSQVGTSFTVEEDQPVADVETNENDVLQLEELTSEKFFEEERSSDQFQLEEAGNLISDIKENESLNVQDKSLQSHINVDVSNLKIDENLILQLEERDSDDHSDDMLNFEDDQQIEPTPESLKMDMSANMDNQEGEKIVEVEDSNLNHISCETDINLSHTTNEDNQNNKSVSPATNQETSQESPSLILINHEKNQEEVIVIKEEASKEEKENHLEEMAIVLTAVTDQQQPSASVETTVAPAILRTSISPKKSDPIEEPHLHHIKTIQDVQGKKLAIVTQNENGPCPLVAIINVS